MTAGFEDNEQFVRQFITEFEEHIEAIEIKLLEVEENIDKNQSLNPETINSLFRSIHTIKGLSGMLDFNNLLDFTHVWENLLDNIRKNKQEISIQIIEVSFRGLDLLIKILAEIKEKRSDKEIKVTDIISELESLLFDNDLESKKLNQANDYLSKLSDIFRNNLLDVEKDKLINEIKNKNNIYQISLFLDKDCFEKDISYLSTCINLEFLGEIINTSINPSFIPSLNDFDHGIFDLQVFILFSTSDNEERIYNIIKNREIQVNRVLFETEIQSNKDNLLSIEKEVSDKIIDNNPKKLSTQNNIRVETKRLDSLLSLIGEQVISKNQLDFISSELLDALGNKNNLIVDKNRLHLIAENFKEIMSTFSRLNNDLQQTVMRIRMLPIGNVFNRFSRVVRDLAKDTGKQIDLIIEGENTELDKTIIEEISDPLIHLIRNAVDHGIETPSERKSKGKSEKGVLHFNAYQQGNGIVITIRDDGRGLNLELIKAKALEKGLITDDAQLSENEIINLIFEAGFSTSNNVTQISGRGVGMDVVRQNIINLKGTIDVETKLNQGTTFIIKLPLTLAIIQALLIKINNQTFAIPLSSVIESYRAKPDEIRVVNNREVLKLRERILPIMYFHDYFELEKSKNDSPYLYIVVIGIAENRVGFIVDKLVGQQEIVIKPLNDPLVRIKGIAGATLIGQDVVLIIDAISILLDSKSYKTANIT